EPLAVRGNLDRHAVAVFRRCLVPLFAPREARARQLLRLGRREAERAPVRAPERAVDRIELERARERERRDDLGARQERQGGRAAVVAAGEIPVEGRDDRVWLVATHVRALPLADARAAGVGEYGAAHLLERVEDPVTLDRLVDALGARRDQERNLRAEPGLHPLRRDMSGATHVLVRGVGARADE